MISKENLETLIKIEKQTNVHMNNLISTYTHKEIQYHKRETGRDDYQNIAPHQGDRAIKVMQCYASRKLGYVNYGENWVE